MVPRHTPRQVIGHTIAYVVLIAAAVVATPLAIRWHLVADPSWDTPLDALACIVALLCSLSLLAHFASTGTRLHLMAGLAFGVIGIETALHTTWPGHWLVRVSTVPEASLPAPIAIRMLLSAVLFLLAPLAAALAPRSTRPGLETVVASLSLVFVAAASSLIATRDGAILDRPLGLGIRPDLFLWSTGAGLAAAGAALLVDYCRRREILTWWLALAAGLHALRYPLLAWTHAPYTPPLLVQNGLEFVASAVLLIGLSSCRSALLREHLRVEGLALADRNLLQAVIDGMPEPTVVIGMDHRIRMASRSVGGHRGRRVGELCYKVLHRRIAPCEDPAGCPLERIRQDPRPLVVEHLHVSPSGVSRLYEILASPLFSPDGSLSGIISAARDITQRVQTAEALRQHSEALEARNEELDAFARTVAHDLKSPLISVYGYARAMQCLDETLRPEQVRDFTRRLVAGAGRALRIVDEILLLATVRQASVETVPVEMKEVVTEALDRLSPLIEEHQASIVVANSLPTPLGHAPWLEEVLTNYVSNAIKYGGRPPRVEIGGELLPENRARIWVLDNGPGLHPSEEKSLFRPFTRMPRPDGEGHGLGLSIVRRIISRLGGEAGVESVPGNGSRFHITLPAAPAPVREELELQA